MGFFTKNEFIAVALIIFAVFLVSLGNYTTALRRARDMQRKNDVRLVSNLVDQYHREYGFYPPSNEAGQISACFELVELEEFRASLSARPESTRFDRDAFFEILHGCDWGEDGLPEPTTEDTRTYIEVLPRDPRASEGVAYFYASNGDFYQIYTYLEGESDEAEYNEGIVGRGLSCGVRTCNFGLSNGNTPLDKSIEEYQNELLEMRMRGEI